MSRTTPVLLVGVLCVGLLRPLAADAALWNPFDGTVAKPTLTERVQTLMRTLLFSIEQASGRIVSAFRLPDPARIGLRAQSFYRPPTVAFPTSTPAPAGLRTPIVIPTPAPSDTPSLAGSSWASDCSCRRGEVCPDDPEKSCEACRRITIGDALTTKADCQAHRHAQTTDGGVPRLEGHF